MLIIYRCHICGEAYITSAPPSHCPFCGAHGHWFVPAANYSEPQQPLELTEISRQNLLFTYNLEVGAARIYHCIRKKSHDEYMVGMFKALSKVELEHAELVGKLLDKNPGCEIPFQEKLCHEDRDSSLRITRDLEANAIKHYTTFLKEATEPRVIAIFRALLEAEQDHLTLVAAQLSSNQHAPGQEGAG